MDKNYLIEFFKDIADIELTEYLHNEKLISESFYDTLNAQPLNESKVYDKRDYYVGNKGFVVSYDVFREMWNDVGAYPDLAMMFDVIVPSEKSLKPDSKRKRMKRIKEHFIEERGSSAANELGAPEDEKSRYELAKEGIDREVKRNPESRVSPGRKGKSTRSVEQINNNDIFAGVFYTDRTKIPKRRWVAWWKIFRQRRTPVPPNPQTAVQSAYRRWEKHFVLGYSVGRGLVFEIWYNTLDSSFSIHDQNGNPMGSGFPTVRLAVEGMFKYIAQFSEDDADFFLSPQARRFNPAGLTSEMEQRMMNARKATQKRAESEAKKNERKQKKDQRENERKTAGIEQAAAQDELERATGTGEYEFDGDGFETGEFGKREKFNRANRKSNVRSGKTATSDAEMRRRMSSAIDYENSTGMGSQWNTDDTRMGYQVGFNESEELEIQDVNSMIEGDMHPLYNKNADRRVDIAKEQSKGQATKEMLANDILGQIEQYNETRFRTRRGKIIGFLSWFKNLFQLGRGDRSAPIEKPVDYRMYGRKIAGYFYGVDTRADFVTGFSMGPIEMEIWYIQEIDKLRNPDGQRTGTAQRASFYVYDVRSRKLLAKDLPYYRLALQAVMQKLGTPTNF